jgi:hypothetical protein
MTSYRTPYDCRLEDIWIGIQHGLDLRRADSDCANGGVLNTHRTGRREFMCVRRHPGGAHHQTRLRPVNHHVPFTDRQTDIGEHAPGIECQRRVETADTGKAVLHDQQYPVARPHAGIA